MDSDTLGVQFVRYVFGFFAEAHARFRDRLVEAAGLALVRWDTDPEGLFAVRLVRRPG